MPGAEPRRRAERRGRLAEWAAAALLLVKGYVPVARRVRTPLGELDLIVRRGRTLAIVEVKARGREADAAGAVSAHQRTRLVRAAQWWIAAHPRYCEDDVRFDVVLVVPRRLPVHLPGAFEA